MIFFFFLIDFNSRKVDRHTPLLFPCSSIKRETLPSSLQQAGLALEVLVSYTTQPHPDILSNISSILDRLSAGDVVYAVFFSPSGIDYSLETFVRECEMKKIGTKVSARISFNPVKTTSCDSSIRIPIYYSNSSNNRIIASLPLKYYTPPCINNVCA